jgi:hypothetical protein
MHVIVPARAIRRSMKRAYERSGTVTMWLDWEAA